jgi:hypothetical protein
VREQIALKRLSSSWEGRRSLPLSLHVHTGGAEQVHADIVAAVEDQQPLVVISGFSTNRAFASTFAQARHIAGAATLPAPPVLSPKHTDNGWRRLVNAQREPVVFGALSTPSSTSSNDLRPTGSHVLPATRIPLPARRQCATQEPGCATCLVLMTYLFISSRPKTEYAALPLRQQHPACTAASSACFRMPCSSFVQCAGP